MSRRAPRSSQDIPSAQNFSPAEIELPRLLELVHANSGNRKALSEAIRVEFYADRSIPTKGQGTVWQNVTTGMVRYGVINDQADPTDLGKELHKIRKDDQRLYRTFAKHLLLHVSGVVLIECLLDMHRAGEIATLPSIREALEERGVHTSTAGKSISLLRAWLAKAGLLVSVRSSIGSNA